MREEIKMDEKSKAIKKPPIVCIGISNHQMKKYQDFFIAIVFIIKMKKAIIAVATANFFSLFMIKL